MHSGAHILNKINLVPSKEMFLQGIEEFEKRERRDPMYKVASFLVNHSWGRPPDMADGLGVLLLTWNQAFYRYGIFDFEKLEKCLNDNLARIESFRGRNITGMSDADEQVIRNLFDQLLIALQIDAGKSRGKKSPVAVAKALHLLAPSFFPLWDKEIAEGYRCSYSEKPAEQYILFSKLMRKLAQAVRAYVQRPDKTLLKLIDEYNYSKFTQEWI